MNQNTTISLFPDKGITFQSIRNEIQTDFSKYPYNFIPAEKDSFINEYLGNLIEI